MENETSKYCVIAHGRALLIKATSYLQSPLLLALRLYWGWQFFQTGKGKLMDLNKVTEFFRGLHIPFPYVNACMAGTTECFGGLLLLAGLFSRLAAIPLIFTMIVAYVTAENEALRHFFDDPDKFVTATPFLFMLTCLMVLAFGPGLFSLDALLFKTEGRKNESAKAV